MPRQSIRNTPRRLSGIFTPHIVPLDTKGDLNEAELGRYVDWLIERGVHGLFPNGSTGEFARFSSEERRRITEGFRCAVTLRGIRAGEGRQDLSPVQRRELTGKRRQLRPLLKSVEAV